MSAKIKKKNQGNKTLVSQPFKSVILLVYLMMSIEFTHSITYFSEATHNITRLFCHNQPLTELSYLVIAELDLVA